MKSQSVDMPLQVTLYSLIFFDILSVSFVRQATPRESTREKLPLKETCFKILSKDCKFYC